VFIGDNGQGDYKVAHDLLSQGRLLNAWIHVVQDIDKTFGYNASQCLPGLFFFTTYIGAACAAYSEGYITEESVVNVIVETKEDLFLIFSDILRRGEVSSPKKRGIHLRQSSRSASVNIEKCVSQINDDISLANAFLSTPQEYIVLPQYK